MIGWALPRVHLFNTRKRLGGKGGYQETLLA